jgi:hypothetical protein
MKHEYIELGTGCQSFCGIMFQPLSEQRHLKGMTNALASNAGWSGVTWSQEKHIPVFNSRLYFEDAIEFSR